MNEMMVIRQVRVTDPVDGLGNALWPPRRPCDTLAPRAEHQ